MKNQSRTLGPEVEMVCISPASNLPVFIAKSTEAFITPISGFHFDTSLSIHSPLGSFSSPTILALGKACGTIGSYPSPSLSEHFSLSAVCHSLQSNSMCFTVSFCRGGERSRA